MLVLVLVLENNVVISIDYFSRSPSLELRLGSEVIFHGCFVYVYFHFNETSIRAHYGSFGPLK